MTKREVIIEALKATLTGIPGVDDSSVYRSRVEPFTRGRVPAVTIEPGPDIPEIDVMPFASWTLTAVILVFVRGDVPDQIADPIVQSIHSKVMADRSIGGLAMDIVPALYKPELLDGDQPVGIFTLHYNVSYRTAIADLSQ